jgi:threonine aldolase
MAAEMLGKEAAVLVTSGTQGNLVGILSQCQRGDEVLIGDTSHIARGEAKGASVLGGVAIQTLRTDGRGMFDPDDIEAAIKDGSNRHENSTALLALENTHNSSGGSVLTPEDTKAMADLARAHDVPVHMDGARIFNAAVYLECPVAELAKDVDTVTFCLSKGLGAPVGSLLCGSEETIDEARRWRKMLGAGMRQAGIIAACGVVALQSMVTRLAEDHANARKLALGLSKIPGIVIEPERLPTNLVFFEVEAENRVELARKVEERGIKGGMTARRWRLAPHYGITSDDIDYTLDVIESTFREYAKA